ncbi:hypothetical protein PAMP_013776 [Pampus punctatissimus]
MELPLVPLPPFLPLPSEPPVPWPRWYESFKTFIGAVGLADASDARLRAMLLHSLSSEGQRVFGTLGLAPKFDDCVALLSGHFATPQSVIVRRIVFRQRKQRPGESIHHYVADLRCLASLCKFGTLEEEMIRDQLAEHTTNPRLREKLFISPDDTTLSRTVELAFQLESAAQLSSQLAASDPPSPRLAALAQTVAKTNPLSEPSSPPDEGRRGFCRFLSILPER